jgi:hypothetical protein
LLREALRLAHRFGGQCEAPCFNLKTGEFKMKTIVLTIFIAFLSVASFTAPSKAEQCYYDKQGQFYCHD